MSDKTSSNNDSRLSNTNCTEHTEQNTGLTRRHFLQNSAGTLLMAGAGSQLLASSANAALPQPGNAASESTCSKARQMQEDMEARYRRAEVLAQGGSARTMVLNTTIYPNWIGDTDNFWYERETWVGKQYRLVNAKTGSNNSAFDHKKLALALAKASGEQVDVDDLPLTDVDINLSPRTISFTAYGKRWDYHEGNQSCREKKVYPKEWGVSPDGKKAVFVRDYNLWLRDLKSGKESPLTKDGEKFYVYAGTPTVYGRQEAPSLEAIWSPDSRRVFTFAIDTRNVKVGAPLVEHVPSDGSLRPRVLHPDRRVAFPADEHIEAYDFFAIEVESGEIQKADFRPSPVLYPPYAGFFTGIRGWWANDSRRAYFIDLERGGKVGRLLEFDTHTGKVKTLIEDRTDSVFTFIPVSHIKTMLVPMPETDELIWFSERSGWSHLYLYDLKTGKLKNPVTQGDWIVRGVLHLDSKRRELFIQTADRKAFSGSKQKAGRNPYYSDICRVNIDTGELTEVLSSDHEYVVCDQRNRITWSKDATGVSPDANYIVTTRSRVDQVPVTLLLDRNGRELFTVETADISGLPKNWQWPEPVMLKAADGKTDIYAVVYRPSDFSPDKNYPVLDCTYAYSAPIGSFTNSPVGSGRYFSPAAYAELGFIVVSVNQRGHERLRDKKFNDYQDPVMPVHHLVPNKFYKEDCVAAIKQLAARHSWVDIDRVGAAEFGSIPHAVAGLFLHSDLYKVGVSINPIADYRIFASMGTDQDNRKPLEDFAENLRGKLLLIHGMLDNVMPAAMTFRLVEALQKANKTFDMLMLPTMGHSANGYATRRSWDHLVKYLLGVEPPKDFDLTTRIDLLYDKLSKQNKKH